MHSALYYYLFPEASWVSKSIDNNAIYLCTNGVLFIDCIVHLLCIAKTIYNNSMLVEACQLQSEYSITPISPNRRPTFIRRPLKSA